MNINYLVRKIFTSKTKYKPNKQHWTFVFTLYAHCRAAVKISRLCNDTDYLLTFKALRTGRAQKEAISYNHLKSTGAPLNTKIYENATALLKKKWLEDCDVLVLAMGGAALNLCLKRIESLIPKLSRRPYIVSLFPGLVNARQREAFTTRLRADLVLMNSLENLETHQAICQEFGLPNNGLLYGLPICANASPKQNLQNPWKTFLFLEQPIAPLAMADRENMLLKIIELANRRPEAKIIIKMRNQPDEKVPMQGLTVINEHLTKTWHRLTHGKSVIPNVEFSYNNIDELIAKTDLCATISSSSFFESWAVGVPCAIITGYLMPDDFGQGMYLDSGCQMTFDDLINGAYPSISETWLNRHYARPDDHHHRLLARLKDFTEHQKSLKICLPLRPQPQFNDNKSNKT